VTAGVASRPGVLADDRSILARNHRRDRMRTYRTTKELVAALAARHVSAVELVDQAIARIETLDAPINAVVGRDFGGFVPPPNFQ
jgi:hypothetical protein